MKIYTKNDLLELKEDVLLLVKPKHDSQIILSPKRLLDLIKITSEVINLPESAVMYGLEISEYQHLSDKNKGDKNET